jgi:hypothetical protein
MRRRRRQHRRHYVCPGTPPYTHDQTKMESGPSPLCGGAPRKEVHSTISLLTL